MLSDIPRSRCRFSACLDTPGTQPKSGHTSRFGAIHGRGCLPVTRSIVRANLSASSYVVKVMHNVSISCKQTASFNGVSEPAQ